MGGKKKIEKGTLKNTGLLIRPLLRACVQLIYLAVVLQTCQRVPVQRELLCAGSQYIYTFFNGEQGRGGGGFL